MSTGLSRSHIDKAENSSGCRWRCGGEAPEPSSPLGGMQATNTYHTKSQDRASLSEFENEHDFGVHSK